jgi:uncharacterized protein DUF4328
MSEFSPDRPVPQYRIVSLSPRLRARVAVAGLAVVAAMASLGSILDIMAYNVLANAGSSPAEADRWTSLDNAAQALYLLTNLFAGISFIVWLHRARTNLDGWDVRGLTWARAWAIGGWFLPFANLVIPLVVVGETGRASENLAASVENRQVSRVSRTIFVLWAVLWNLSGVTAVAAVLAGARLRTGTPRELAEHHGLYAALSYGNAVVVIVAAALAILLVRGVTASQESILRATPIAGYTQLAGI